jgi:hypothetical protein
MNRSGPPAQLQRDVSHRIARLREIYPVLQMIEKQPTLNQIHTLAQLQAYVDALWVPFRYGSEMSATVGAAIMEKRQDYPGCGVPLIVKGDGTQRLAGERELRALEKGGFIRLHFERKRIGCSFTHFGDDYTRSLTAGDTARATHHLMKRMTTAQKSGTNAGFVLETDILKTSYDKVSSAQLVALENMLLPLLHRGWVESHSDGEGRIGYRVTPVGSKQRIPKALVSPSFDDYCCREYDRMFLEALAERETWTPSSPASISIPLSAGRWSSKKKPNVLSV